MRLIEGLEKAKDGARALPLAEVVAHNLTHLWEHGGRRGKTEAGFQPPWIRVRPEFMFRPSDDPRGPALPRLVKPRGLQLRLALLLLFDAQCRHAPGNPVRNERKVSPHADDQYTSWRQLVLAPAPAENSTRGAGDLRARQITEAFLALEQQNLLAIKHAASGRRRTYDDLELLSDASTPEESPSYTVPATGVPISPYLFTNLWLFALTDTELATFLVLSRLRGHYPYRHATEGIYLPDKDRETVYRLTRATWRSTDTLHRYGLIDRVKDPRRSFTTGKVGNFGTRWAKGEVMPVHYKINDDGLRQPALATIRRVLTAPTDADRARREGRELIVGLEDM
ncbi:hypothetical protein OHQ88_33435 (plasmid) [Micromonospora zamorensis]|uniref:hypothetical protein n=1 Tax=Micromonospora zamorensis TaxID=709883 RepID=UPI002E1F8F49